MMPMLRFFRHADGNFAQFNGMGPTPVDLLATVLAYDDARGTPVSNAPHSGYQRIDAGSTAMLMDTGRPPPLALSQEAHAGCLSFELSWKHAAHRGQLRLAGGEQGKLAAGGARHRRAFDRHFQRRVIVPFPRISPFRRLLFGTPIVSGPRNVRVAREDTPDGATLTRLARRLRRRYDVIHQRALRLSADGRALDGEDSSRRPPAPRCRWTNTTNSPCASTCIPRSRPTGCRRPRRDAAAAQPRAVDVHRLRRNGCEIEESVYPRRPRRPAPHHADRDLRPRPHTAQVRWSFRATPPAPPRTRPERADEPELPL